MCERDYSIYIFGIGKKEIASPDEYRLWNASIYGLCVHAHVNICIHNMLKRERLGSSYCKWQYHRFVALSRGRNEHFQPTGPPGQCNIDSTGPTKLSLAHI